MSDSPRVLVTGASGFVGRALVRRLAQAGWEVTGMSRSPLSGQANVPAARWIRADVARDPLEPALEGVDAVVHAAGIAHAAAAESMHRSVTVEGTRRLVEAMRRAGPSRLIFLSSIRAQVGGYTPRRVGDGHALAPIDAYGRAKRDAEELVAASGLSATILRPVLVADVGARGNLAALLRLARVPLPLPFGDLTAQRSLVSRTALADAVTFVLDRAEAQGRRFNVADDAPLDVAHMLTILRRGMRRPPDLIAVPTPTLYILLRLSGRSGMFDRLGRPLVVAADGLRALGWEAPEWAAEALYRMGRKVGRAG